jgi:uncharacterized protein (DUF2236 family)
MVELPRPRVSPRPPLAADSGSLQSDLGFFGPQSISWKVHADPLFGAAGLRALFLQALHPRAMAGLAQNSDFQSAPWSRLMRTADYVVTVTFGARAEARRAAGVVRAVHRRLTARDPVTGEQFRIDDPELLRWVHVVEAESFLSTARRGGLRLDAEQVDRYYREQLQAAELIGLDPATVPSCAQEVADYYQRMRPQLGANAEARAAVRYLLWPPMPRRPSLVLARPGWMLLAGLGFSLMPGWARRLYGLPGLGVGDMAPTLSVRALRGLMTGLPTPLREGPPKIREAHRRAQSAAAAEI